MKKIAFHLNSLEQGGAERVVSNLANRFVKDGYEVLIATEWQGENEYPIDEKIRRVHVGLKKEDENKGRVKKFLLRIKYLKEFMKNEKPDVLVAFAHKANYRALMACKGTDVPVVFSVRTNPTGHYDAISDKIQIKTLFKRASGAVFQTREQMEYFGKYAPKNSTVILNPIHPKYFGIKHPELKEKVVVQSARLVDFKNQPMLIRAFIRVHEKYPDYVLKIYGEDSHDGTKEILENLIKEKNASDFVFLMGGCNNLEKEIPKAKVYAFSSDWEGLPNALMEAMAMGMPIVATDCPCGGPKELITSEENGLLVPIMNEEALANGIIRLIEDEKLALRLGENARNIENRASIDIIYSMWKEYLEQVLAK